MSHENLQIGLIEDDPIMGGSIVQRLELEGCAVRWWRSGRAALEADANGVNDLDLVLCDLRLPDIGGEDIYRDMSARENHPPFIFITGYGEIDQAVRLMRLGAADYLTKPFDFDDFLSRIHANARNPAPAPNHAPVLGVSPGMAALEALLARYAQTDLPVLLTGETGVGKEVAARHLHTLGCAPDAPFMAVNCAAIPSELLESEIFGHEKGAFSGAAKRHLGYAERAKSGVLFLDEIGDMPAALQAKLLRLIEERCFHRVGGEENIPFLGRIVTATHKTLEPGACDADFRQDLYYRIAVLTAKIPPLRERLSDIPWLTQLFIAEAAARHDKVIRGVSTQAEEMTLAHVWPGNIRELRNRIERAVALCSGEWLTPHDLFPEQHSRTDAETFQSLQNVRDAAEKRQIERALVETCGHIQAAAGLLGVSRTTLWEKMTRLEIKSERKEN